MRHPEKSFNYFQGHDFRKSKCYSVTVSQRQLAQYVKISSEYSASYEN